MSDRGNRPVGSWPSPPVITPASELSLGVEIRQYVAAAPVSGTNPFTVNDMLAFPFLLTTSTTFYKGFWVNGSGPGGNSVTAIYDADFNLLAQSASTTGVNANVPQPVTMAVKLAPGLYYGALAHDSATTSRFFRWGASASFGASVWKALGCWKQASVTLATLPNPATPTAYTSTLFPLFGLITRTVFDV